MTTTISTLLTLPPVEREQQFLDVCVSRNKSEVLSQINTLLPSSRHTTLLSRWKCRVLLQRVAEISEEDWKWVLQEHLLLSILTNIELTETIIENLYFYAKTSVETVAEADLVQNRYVLLRQYMTTSTAMISLDATDTLSMSELVLRLKKEKSDSLAYSELLLKMKETLYQTALKAEIPEADVSATADNALAELMDVIDFLTGPAPTDIYPTVLKNMEPELFDSTSEESTKVLQRVYNDDRTLYEQVHDTVLVRFGLPWELDNDGISRLIAFLTQIAATTKDPKVQELVVFDEQTGKFDFNEDLLDT